MDQKNLVFVPHNAKVIELFHPGGQTACYKNLALACGLRYTALTGTPTGEPARNIDHDTEFKVDIPKILHLLTGSG